MALLTAGSETDSTFQALAFFSGYGEMSDRDRGTFANLILDDVSGNIVPGSLPVGGPLYIPRRGFLIPQPGDYYVIDTAGFPFLVPANSFTNGGWDHS